MRITINTNHNELTCLEIHKKSYDWILTPNLLFLGQFFFNHHVFMAAIKILVST